MQNLLPTKSPVELKNPVELNGVFLVGASTEGYFDRKFHSALRGFRMLIARKSWIVWAFTGLVAFSATNAEAQITAPRILSATPDRFATLEERLTNRLRAVAEDQRAFIRFVVGLTRQGKLDLRLIAAIERYALKRSSALPFPYFERVIRFEGDKRGLVIPPVRQFATTKIPVP